MPRIRHETTEAERDNFTPLEVAQLNLLHLKRTMVYEYIKRGDIRAVMGKSGETRITKDEIRRLQALWKLDPEREPDKLLVQAELRERGRKGGYTRAKKYSKSEMGAQTRAGKRAALIREIDPSGMMPPAELERRIHEAQMAQMAENRRKGIQRKMFTQQYRRNHNNPEGEHDNDQRREARADQANS